MDKETKIAPLISFNNHFNHHDPYSDEELLVVNSPIKKMSNIERRSTVDKGCMTESDLDHFMQQPNLIDESSKRVQKTTNALIIGEIPISLNELYQKNKCRNSNEIDQGIINYIDSSISSDSFVRAPIIPYLILPFTSGLHKLKNEGLIIENEGLRGDINSLTNTIQSIRNDDKTEKTEIKETVDTVSVKTEIKREQWAYKTEFLLAIIGFSVDLGNIWRCIFNYFFLSNYSNLFN